MNKKEYLEKEARQLQLSKECNAGYIGIDYMIGYREGYNRAYEDIIKLLKLMNSSNECADIVYESFDMINKLNNMSCNLEYQNESEIDDKERLSVKKLEDRINDQKKRASEIEKKLLDIGYSKDLVYLPYSLNCDNSSLNIDLDDIIHLVERYKYTDDELDTVLKALKADYGMYYDLGEKEEEEISKSVYDEFYNMQKKNSVSAIQDDLVGRYHNRSRQAVVNVQGARNE